MKKFLILLALSGILPSCVNNVKIGSVFNIDGSILDKHYGDQPLEARFCTDVLYSVKGSSDSKSFSKSICEKGTIIDNVLKVSFPLNINLKKTESLIDITAFNNTRVEVQSSAKAMDILVVKNAQITKNNDFSYNVSLGLVFDHSMDIDQKMKDFQDCYAQLLISMPADSAYSRCKELVYNYSN